MTVRSIALAACVSVLAAACSKPDPTRVRGTALVQDIVRDLYPSPTGAHVATLVRALPSKEKGAPQDVFVGSLHLASVVEGTQRRLGGDVTNLPGALLYSQDGEWIAFLAGYSLQRAVGELRVTRTKGGSVELFADDVSFFAFSPTSDRIAYVAGGELFVRSLAGGEPKSIATGVSMVEFGPKDGPAANKLLVKRAARHGGALLLVDLATGRTTAIARQATAFTFAPSGEAFAFQAQGLLPADAIEPESRLSGTRKFEDAPGLYVAPLTGKPVRVSPAGATDFRFAPTGRRLAFVRTPSVGATGDLYVVDEAGEATQVAPKVAQMLWTPDGSLLLLGAWSQAAAAGTLGIKPPEGDVIEWARNVKQFALTPNGRFVLFSQATMVNGVFSLALAVQRVDASADAKPRIVDAGVFGYEADENEQLLAYKAYCIDGGHACSLYVTGLGAGRENELLSARIAAFEFVPGESRLVVVASRREGKQHNLLYSLGVLPTDVTGDKQPALHVLDDQVTGDFVIAGPQRRHVVYTVNEHNRQGLYVAPLPSVAQHAAAQ